MPIFDFVCKKCGKEFEFLAMGNDRPFCPKCKSDDLRKQMSSFSTRLSGTSGSTGGGCAGCAGKNCSTCG